MKTTEIEDARKKKPMINRTEDKDELKDMVVWRMR